MAPVTRGFDGARRRTPRGPLPPGQYDAGDEFPVLTAGPTPVLDTADWDLTVAGQVDDELRWSWQEFRELPRERVEVDIHCVTSWSKFGTRWSGVSVDTLLDGVETAAEFVLARCSGGYTTNLPLDDVTGGRAWVVDTFDGEPLTVEHGGPARLLVPHLYFWKSAKWLRSLVLTLEEEPGFWEVNGYHRYGDPWLEQRWDGD